MSTVVTIPEHQLIERLRDGADRLVFRGRYRGEACVTRVILRPVPLPLGGLISGVVRSGVGSLAGLDDEVIATLEGYRVRCRLGDMAGLPAVCAAGLAEAPDRCPPGTGLPFVTTRWIPGRTLRNAGAARAEREAALCGVLRILRALHEANTVYGDLKPANVVLSSDGVHLIDLDTLREVADGRHPIQVTHRTPRYAAPEQEGVPPLSYPASDIFTFGLLACELLGGARRGEVGFPPRLPPPWGAVVDACFRHQPLDRPPADALLEFIDGTIDHLPAWSGAPLRFATEPVRDYTQPVPEPAAVSDDAPPPRPTPPVLDAVTRTISRDGIAPPPPPALTEAVIAEPEPEPEPRPVVALEPAPRPARSRPWVMWLGVLVVIVGSGAGIAAAAWMSREVQAREAAEAEEVRLLAKLKEHKTVPEKNGLDTLKALVEETRAALDARETAALLGLYALERVWQQKWHWGGASWDAGRFSEGRGLVRGALDAEEGATALLAKGVLYGGACRTMPAAESERRLSRCQASLDALGRAARLVEGDSSLDWLAVEITWATVMTAQAMARHVEPEDAGQAAALREQAVALCLAGKHQLPAAPVNGRELIETCLDVSGELHRYDLYVSWADWLQTDELERTGQRSERLAARLIKSVDPACGSMEVDGSHPPVLGFDRGGIEDVCRFVGSVALGCVEVAEDFRACRKRTFRFGKPVCIDSLRQEGVPWDEALAVAEAPARTDCFWGD